jgi:hypothetical protein
MADLIDKAESDMSQMINRVGSQAVSRGGRAAVKLSINVAKSVTNAPYAAAAAVWEQPVGPSTRPRTPAR